VILRPSSEIGSNFVADGVLSFATESELTEDPSQGPERSNLGTTNYLYDGDDLTEELDQSGSVLSRYAQNARYPVGPAIDEPLSMLRSGTTNYYQSAGLSSITSLSNSSGNLVASYTYDSFGNLTASSGTITNPFRFTGREFDSETGIYEYRHRYYDPSIGRFISEDPLHFGGGDLDVYVYVHSEPTNYVDPSGTTRYWGNWCGPDWTGGLVEEYTPLHAGIYKKPQDAEDTVCMHHDICYFNCRYNHACDSGARPACLKHCDQIFLAEMPMTAVGGYLSDGIFYHSLSPGNGGSDAHCGCRWAMYPTSLPGLDIGILAKLGSR
jgi:RHS repeat-associated protein